MSEVLNRAKKRFKGDEYRLLLVSSPYKTSIIKIKINKDDKKRLSESRRITND